MEQYKIGQLLGEGSFAKVYSAIHLRTNIKVAIKIIKKELIIDDIMRERVNCEIDALKKLSSPYIAQLLQVIEDAKKIYLVIQFACNKDLFSYLKNQGKLDEEEAGRITYQILCACKYIHKEGIAHRDLKLANIMLTGKMNVKIGDFGFSKPYHLGHKLHTSCGSPCFAAPELLESVSYDPQKSDIWSIGVVCYSMLAATLPFYHNSIHKLYQIIGRCEYAELNFVSESCRDFLSRIFVRNPEKRFSFNEAFSHSFIQKSAKNHQLRKYRNFQTDPLYQKLIHLKNDTIIKILEFLDPDNIQQYKSALFSQNFDKYYANIAILRTLSQQELEKKLSLYTNNSSQLLIQSLKLKNIKQSNLKVTTTRFNRSNNGKSRSKSPIIRKNKNLNSLHLQSSHSPTSPLINHINQTKYIPNHSFKLLSKANSKNSIQSIHLSNKASTNLSTLQKDANTPIRKIHSIFENSGTANNSTKNKGHSPSTQLPSFKLYKSLENTNFTSLQKSLKKQVSTPSFKSPPKKQNSLLYNICHTIKLSSPLDRFFKVGQKIQAINIINIDEEQMQIEYQGQQYRVTFEKVHNLARKVIRTYPHSPQVIHIIKQHIKN